MTALPRPSAAVAHRASSSSGTPSSSPSSTVPSPTASASSCPRSRRSPSTTSSPLPTPARSAEAILASGMTPVAADMLRRLPEVRLVVTDSTGLNHIDVAECRRRGIGIASGGDAYSEEVAGLAVGLLIDVLRKVSASDRCVRRGLWSSEGEFALGSKLSELASSLYLSLTILVINGCLDECLAIMNGELSESELQSNVQESAF